MKNKFFKFYQYGLLPLYLVVNFWLFGNYLMSYGLPIPNANIPIFCTITIGFTEMLYISFIGLLFFLLIEFRTLRKVVYYLNMVMLFLFPLIQQIGTIITQVLLNELNQPSNISIFSYVIVYVIIFVPIFLPQILYFRKRKDLFLTNISDE